MNTIVQNVFDLLFGSNDLDNSQAALKNIRQLPFSGKISQIPGLRKIHTGQKKNVRFLK